jgi:hypothetical protein
VREEKYIPSSCGENYTERDYFKDLGVDKRVTLKSILKKYIFRA